jgi:hypothetical protein
MSTRAPAFTLTKWYLDCTDADGRVAIVYWASLTWHGLALTWQGLSVTENGCEAIHRSTLAAGGMPARERDRILWRSPGLECELVADVHDPPIAVRLFESEGGFVDWRCEAPAALVTLDLAGGSTLRGPGYAERLELTIPPWRLPITELRWGRWIDDAAARSVIWIDWRGAEPRIWVFVDGVPFTDAAVSDDRVSVGDATLVLACRSALSSRAADEIIDGIPGLRALIPISVFTPREMKWSSRGILQRVGVVPIEGRAIHELVAFR